MTEEIFNIDEIPVKTLLSTRHARVVIDPEENQRFYLLKRRDILEVNQETFDAWVELVKEKGFKVCETINVDVLK